MAMDPQAFVQVLEQAGFACEWDYGFTKPCLKVPLGQGNTSGAPPPFAYITEDNGEKGFWHGANTRLFYKGDLVKPEHRNTLQKLTLFLSSQIAGPVAWEDAGDDERRLGFARLEPNRGDDPLGMWMLLIPSPCQQTCLFCNRSFGFRLDHEKALRAPQEQARFLAQQLQKHRLKPGTAMIVGGHEPLTLPGLEELLAILHEHHCHPRRLQTAGWPITPQQAWRLTRLGVEEVDIPFYSHQPEVHDQVVAFPGAFEKAVAGVRIFRDQGIRLISHTVLLQQNVEQLPNITALVQELGAVEFAVRFPTEVSAPTWAERRLTPSLVAVRRALAALPPVALEGWFLRLTLPPCAVPVGWQNRLMPQGASPEQVFPPTCTPCAVRSRCTGLGASYAAMHGEEDIHPLSRG